jgi:inositol phosphorylceramide mannosyltransferase catalytic subunit
MNQTIPKRIIQVWGTGPEMPLFCKCSAANVRLLNPDFEYELFNNARMEQFVSDHFPQYRSVLESFRFPVQRYDFFRYLAIYHLGGFYFDLDVFFASNLAPLLNERCVFPFETLTASIFLRSQYNMDWEVGNYSFGAAAGHPFIGAVIENCVRAQKDSAWAEEMVKSVPRIFREYFYVLYTTGPWLVSRTLAEFPDVANQVRILFPDDVSDRSGWSCFGRFGVHLMRGGWRGRGSRVRKRLMGMWESMLFKKMLKESRDRGKTRALSFSSRGAS